MVSSVDRAVGHVLGKLDKLGLRDRDPHYSNQGGFPGGAIRVGNWKLVERYEDGRAHLYNLSNDVGEQNDLASVMPGKVTDLRTRLHTWYKEVDAKFLQAKESGPEPWRPQD